MVNRPPAGKELARSTDAAPPLKTKPSSLPHSVALAIADPPMVEVEGELKPGAWNPPTYCRFLPEQLDQAREAMREQLRPAGSQGVREVMLPLIMVTKVAATEGMSDGTARAYMAELGREYERHLIDVPLDILKAASDACATESAFFPTVADLFRHIRPELEKRKRMADRIEALARAQNGIPATIHRPMTEEEKRETQIKKLREAIPVLRKHGRNATADQWERELAELTGSLTPPRFE